MATVIRPVDILVHELRAALETCKQQRLVEFQLGLTVKLASEIVTALTAAKAVRLEVSTLLSARTKEGLVELRLNDERTQMDLAKAREVSGMMLGAIEAATSDQLVYAWLTTKLGLDDERATRALLDFRELRQGSRETVYPS